MKFMHNELNKFHGPPSAGLNFCPFNHRYNAKERIHAI